MPELPDLEIYVAALTERVTGSRLRGIRFPSAFILRTTDPEPQSLIGREALQVRRLGKRIVIPFFGEHYLCIHLMIAGRLVWTDDPARRVRTAQAVMQFDAGTLVVTEAGTRKRAAMHILRGPAALELLDRGGIEVLEADFAEFDAALTCENHTLRRALTDPRLFSGIGNAYADEILHAARLSPLQRTSKLSENARRRLFRAATKTLADWTARLREHYGGRFPNPNEVTAFRNGFAVHGRFGQPCPDCRTPVQRIRWAENETNYCPVCQTGGRVLADRSLSRLLHDDWPRTADELE
ncbi:MAG: formamidopyrimidine-DNA glycosylase [Planctomycetota bacterium]|nr:MAG: formamidopyrimidine-DNA glycosylase [Planctomycetota bacterium]